MIPKPKAKSKEPLDLAMGLGGRYDRYIRIRVCISPPVHIQTLDLADALPTTHLGPGSEDCAQLWDRLVKSLVRGPCAAESYAV